MFGLPLRVVSAALEGGVHPDCLRRVGPVKACEACTEIMIQTIDILYLGIALAADRVKALAAETAADQEAERSRG